MFFVLFCSYHTITERTTAGNTKQYADETNKNDRTGEITNKCSDQKADISGRSLRGYNSVVLDDKTNTDLNDGLDIPPKKRRKQKRKAMQAVETCNKGINPDFSDASWENAIETATVAIYRKDALVVEESNRDQSRRFCVQGQIEKDDCITQVSVFFGFEDFFRLRPQIY